MARKHRKTKSSFKEDSNLYRLKTTQIINEGDPVTIDTQGSVAVLTEDQMDNSKHLIGIAGSSNKSLGDLRDVTISDNLAVANRNDLVPHQLYSYPTSDYELRSDANTNVIKNIKSDQMYTEEDGWAMDVLTITMGTSERPSPDQLLFFRIEGIQFLLIMSSNGNWVFKKLNFNESSFMSGSSTWQTGHVLSLTSLPTIMGNTSSSPAYGATVRNKFPSYVYDDEYLYLIAEKGSSYNIFAIPIVRNAENEITAFSYDEDDEVVYTSLMTYSLAYGNGSLVKYSNIGQFYISHSYGSFIIQRFNVGMTTLEGVSTKAIGHPPEKYVYVGDYAGYVKQYIFSESEDCLYFLSLNGSNTYLHTLRWEMKLDGYDDVYTINTCTTLMNPSPNSKVYLFKNTKGEICIVRGNTYSKVKELGPDNFSFEDYTLINQTNVIRFGGNRNYFYLSNNRTGYMEFMAYGTSSFVYVDGSEHDASLLSDSEKFAMHYLGDHGKYVGIESFYYAGSMPDGQVSKMSETYVVEMQIDDNNNTITYGDYHKIDYNTIIDTLTMGESSYCDIDQRYGIYYDEFKQVVNIAFYQGYQDWNLDPYNPAGYMIPTSINTANLKWSALSLKSNFETFDKSKIVAEAVSKDYLLAISKPPNICQASKISFNNSKWSINNVGDKLVFSYDDKVHLISMGSNEFKVRGKALADQSIFSFDEVANTGAEATDSYWGADINGFTYRAVIVVNGQVFGGTLGSGTTEVTVDGNTYTRGDLMLTGKTVSPSTGTYEFGTGSNFHLYKISGSFPV